MKKNIDKILGENGYSDNSVGPVRFENGEFNEHDIGGILGDSDLKFVLYGRFVREKRKEIAIVVKKVNEKRYWIALYEKEK